MNQTNLPEGKQITEKILKPLPGLPILLLNIAGIILSIVLVIWSVVQEEEVMVQTEFFTEMSTEMPDHAMVTLLFSLLVLLPLCCVNFGGLKAVSPNEALVLTLLGKYHGTINQAGYFFVNPFCTAYNPTKQIPAPSTSGSITNVTLNKSEDNNNKDKTSGKKISMKAITLNNRTQKVNDLDGNPIEIAAMVIWKVASPATAVFAVDNYLEFISMQSDSTLRNVASRYAYDDDGDDTTLTLRGNSEEIALQLQDKLSEKVKVAGLEVLEVKITHLAYAPEIAAAMLQRQQASAILAARRLIVEGAVGMVQQALAKLDQENIVNLDDERKATMISNLLVVLCANKEAQPVVNSGSIY